LAFDFYFYKVNQNKFINIRLKIFFGLIFGILLSIKKITIMKRILLLLAVVGIITLSGCEGDRGPQGPQGPMGESEVFEVTTDFVPDIDPELSYRSFFDLNPVILPADNLLVYELAAVQNNLDVWKLLPQIYTFSDGGIAQYNFDFTTNDFSIFLDANFDRANLPAGWVQNKTFRIVIVPGYFSRGGTPVAYSDYHAVLKAYDIDDSNVKILTQKIR